MSGWIKKAISGIHTLHPGNRPEYIGIKGKRHVHVKQPDKVVERVDRDKARREEKRKRIAEKHALHVDANKHDKKVKADYIKKHGAPKHGIFIRVPKGGNIA